jgi:hypothetical protein
MRTALDGRLEEFNFRVRVFDEDLAKAMSAKSPAEQIGRLKAAQLADPVAAEWADGLGDLQFLLLLQTEDVSDQVI